MQPIADWLEKLGLSEYAQPFADNDIDFTILRDLTDQDLEKIGIASLGHRRKILRAIGNLEPIETRSPACAVEAPAVPLPLESAERRQVTVMFCDLVGSTALSARMDPEDLREVIAAYHRCAAEIVRRFGGFVAQYHGRRRTRLFWISAGPRGRRRASGTGWAGTDTGSLANSRRMRRCKPVLALPPVWLWLAT